MVLVRSSERPPILTGWRYLPGDVDGEGGQFNSGGSATGGAMIHVGIHGVHGDPRRSVTLADEVWSRA
jgi:hypothetical protein